MRAKKKSIILLANKVTYAIEQLKNLLFMASIKSLAPNGVITVL